MIEIIAWWLLAIPTGTLAVIITISGLHLVKASFGGFGSDPVAFIRDHHEPMETVIGIVITLFGCAVFLAVMALHP